MSLDGGVRSIERDGKQDGMCGERGSALLLARDDFGV